MKTKRFIVILIVFLCSMGLVTLGLSAVQGAQAAAASNPVGEGIFSPQGANFRQLKGEIEAGETQAQLYVQTAANFDTQVEVMNKFLEWCMPDPFAPILLVDDDDNAPDVQQTYLDVFDVLGLTYDVWDTDNTDIAEPTQGDLVGYEGVVWFTGDEFGGFAGPGATTEEILADWLISGPDKCLLITSQDYLYDRGLTSFMSTYLGLSDGASDAAVVEVTGRGDFSGLGPFLLEYPFTNFSDVLYPSNNADVAFQGLFDGMSAPAAISYISNTFRTSFWGFPFEALGSISTCHATPDSGKSVYTSVQEAVDATTGGIIKVAGRCEGARPRVLPPFSTVVTQTVYITGTYNLWGGYTTSNWGTPDPVANPTVLDAQRGGRVLHVDSGGSATVRDMTLTNGFYGSSGGGGIYNVGTLVLDGVAVTSNSADGSGGGIRNASSSSSALTVINSTLNGNSTPFDGGGLYSVGGTISIENSTVSGNNAGGSGGGMKIGCGECSSTAFLNNVTIYNNIADADTDDFGDGGGIYNAFSSITILNSIIAGNADKSPGLTTSNVHPDCTKSFNSPNATLVNSVIGEDSGCPEFVDGVNGNQVGTSPSPLDPVLGPLQDNGGGTLTHALLPASPAIDAGNGAAPGSGGNACEATDQRGVTRPLGFACDAGAYEFQPPDLAVSKNADKSFALPGDSILYTIDYVNNGPTEALGVLISDTVPAVLKNIVATHEGVVTTTPEGTTLNWVVDTLPANSGGVISITGTVDPNLPFTTTITNIVSINSQIGNSIPSNDQDSAVFTAGYIPQADQVLLVDDDDNAPDVRSYYQSALEGLGLGYKVWDTANSDNEPDSATLALYDEVIWFTGDEFGGFAGPGAASEETLTDWLFTGPGRCLLISSQDYLYDRGHTGFMTVTLGLDSYNQDAGVVTATGRTVFAGLGSYGLVYPFTNYSDILTPTTSADTAFLGENASLTGPTAISHDTGTYRTSFWGFPWEAIPTGADRQEALNRFLQWCNFPPVAVGDTRTTNEDTAVNINVVSNDLDEDNDTLSVVNVGSPNNGTTAIVSRTSVQYTPALNFNGTDVFAYRVSDGTLTDVGFVTVTVTAQNDPPTANDDTAATTVNTPVTISVLSNDSDPDGDLLSVVSVGQASNGATSHDATSVTYTPKIGFAGGDVFTYTISDGSLSDTGLVNVTVNEAAQTGPVFTVNTVDDTDDGVCGLAHCSLREAVEAANARTNGANPDEIQFDIPGTGLKTVALGTALPTITDPVIVDGTTQTGAANICASSPPVPMIKLDGTGAGAGAQGLVVIASNNTIRGLQVTGFSGDGISLSGSDNRLECNLINGNNGDGVGVLSGRRNQITGNSIFGNGSLGIDLSGDGLTPNDVGDQDSGANDLQNFPAITQVLTGPISTTISGQFNAITDTIYTLDFYLNATCDATGFGEGEVHLFSDMVNAGSTGATRFKVSYPGTLPAGWFVSSTATDPNGNTSEFSNCKTQGLENTAWPLAKEVSMRELTTGVFSGTVEGYVDTRGQSRWYKFPIAPGGKVTVTLTGGSPLPANYDLTLYKDIAVTFESLLAPESEEDLLLAGAESAPGMFAPGMFAPGMFAPGMFAPGMFAPGMFAPGMFAPGMFAPGMFAPDASAPGMFAPGMFAPDVLAPDAYAPGMFAPGMFAPDTFDPSLFASDLFDEEAFSNAQLLSLIGVSAFEGRTTEGLIINTWQRTGNFYVRVKGRNGAFSLDGPFRLGVQFESNVCRGLTTDLAFDPTELVSAEAGDYKTLILWDSSRSDLMGGTQGEIALMQERMSELAARPEVKGLIVDVGEDAWVTAANVQADAMPECPVAKNLVAEAIKAIIERNWEANNDTLEYLVIIGNDEGIPFFRHPDNAGLGSETEYVPPVLDFTSSQASLQLGYYLTQDWYGSRLNLSNRSSKLPVLELAVGRLVENPTDIITMLEAYLGTPDGVVAPNSALVTGYDFLEDAAKAVQQQIEAGTGITADTLIQDSKYSPEDPSAWSADDLRELMFNKRYDLIFLAGHFSAYGALAADYETFILTPELDSAKVDFTNSIIFSNGCHAGYNVVNPHAVLIPELNPEPDWPQAFNRRGAVLIAGTGYQYGDTDFLEHSERVYRNFSREIKSRQGPMPVGKALTNAKLAFLKNTKNMNGIQEKSLLEITLFGLPMMSVDMFGGGNVGRTVAAPEGKTGTSPANIGRTTIVDDTIPFDTNPGAFLELEYADLQLTPVLTVTEVTLTSLTSQGTTSSINATYVQGSDGVVSNPMEPVLPLEVENVGVPDLVMRGIGFRGSTYMDLADVLPLTGAPTTEIRGVHLPFYSDVFYPVQWWGANYFDALVNGLSGETNLMLTPAQYISNETGSLNGTLRIHNEVDLRLYYSNNTKKYNGVTPASSAPPTIAHVFAKTEGNQVKFRVQVVGNPAAGIQEVWVTYTATGGPLNGKWQSLDLTQNAADSTLWEGTLPLNGTESTNIRYMVQAVNGVGLVTLNTNMGEYFQPDIDPGLLDPAQDDDAAGSGKQTATVELLSTPTSGGYSSQVNLSAKLTTNGTPLVGRLVTLGIGNQILQGITDQEGVAQVTIPLLSRIGRTQIKATFPGSAEYSATSTTTGFTVKKQGTVISIEQIPEVVHLGGEQTLVANLTDVDDKPLRERTVVFVIDGGGEKYDHTVITDYTGRARLGAIPLPVGSYTVKAYFSGEITLSGGQKVALSDQRYLPSSQTVNLLIEPNVLYLPFIGKNFAEMEPKVDTPTPEPTPDDGNGNQEAVTNGGFEEELGWELPSTTYSADYSTTQHNEGARSMRTGIVDQEDNRFSYSSARQLVTVPEDAESVKLRFWIYPQTDETLRLPLKDPPLGITPEQSAWYSDAQIVLVLDDAKLGAETELERLLTARLNDREWIFYEFDLSDYAGETIKLYFGVYNNGLYGTTSMYVDDVSLEISTQ